MEILISFMEVSIRPQEILGKVTFLLDVTFALFNLRKLNELVEQPR